jgi:two-component system chemotaxis response regulator CheB
MADIITKLTRAQVDDLSPAAMSPVEQFEADIAQHGLEEGGLRMSTIGEPSGFTCPDCDGSLITVPGTRRYRCRVGHAWTEEALAEQKDAELERALWTALRTLDEKISLGRRMEQTAAERGNGHVASRCAAAVAEVAQAADVQRHFIRTDVLAQEGTAT